MVVDGHLAGQSIVVKVLLSPGVFDFHPVLILRQIGDGRGPVVLLAEDNRIAVAQEDFQGFGPDAVLIARVVPDLGDADFDELRFMGVGHHKTVLGIAFDGDSVRGAVHGDHQRAIAFDRADFLNRVDDLEAFVINGQAGPADGPVLGVRFNEPLGILHRHGLVLSVLVHVSPER